MRKETNEKLLSEYSEHEEYEERIESLREDGEEDGVFINPESEKDFWKFMGPEDSGLPRCDIVLLENGNLRGIWASDTAKRSIAIQFLGNGQGQYVSMYDKMFDAAMNGTAKIVSENYDAGRASLNVLEGVMRFYEKICGTKKEISEIKEMGI